MEEVLSKDFIQEILGKTTHENISELVELLKTHWKMNERELTPLLIPHFIEAAQNKAISKPSICVNIILELLKYFDEDEQANILDKLLGLLQPFVKNAAKDLHMYEFTIELICGLHCEDYLGNADLATLVDLKPSEIPLSQMIVQTSEHNIYLQNEQELRLKKIFQHY